MTGPKLLAGGNPQIPKGYGQAAVDAYIEAMPEWKQDVGRRLDELISKALPAVRKAVKWNSPFYGIEGLGWIISFHCFTKYVKVTFFAGSRLEPEPPKGSKDPYARYAHVEEGEVIDEELWSSWVKQAATHPGWATADIETWLEG